MTGILTTIWGIISLSCAFLRSAPDYESSLETQALMGTTVEVLASEGHWLQVRCTDPEYTAWVDAMAVTTKTEEELALYCASPKLICTVHTTAVRDLPGSRGRQVCELILGDEVQPLGKHRGGYLEVSAPDGTSGWVRKSELAPCPGPAEDFPVEGLIATAQDFLGSPYLWGGNSSKGTDCSGLVWLACHMHGFKMPRNASQQARMGSDVPMPAGPATGRKSLDALQRGDLLFFGREATAEKPAAVTHVAIYLGGGRILHSSQKVRINTLLPGQSDSYGREPLFARRLTRNN